MDSSYIKTLMERETDNRQRTAAAQHKRDVETKAAMDAEAVADVDCDDCYNWHNIDC